MPEESQFPQAGAYPANLLNPQFQVFFRYNGNYGRSRPPKDASNRYFNYSGFPVPNFGDVDHPFGHRNSPYEMDERRQHPDGTDPARVEQFKLMANTTGIDGGGIVRGVFPLKDVRDPANTADDEVTGYRVYDLYDYRDPNGYCSRPGSARVVGDYLPIAQWIFVRPISAAIAASGEQVEGFVPFKHPAPGTTDTTGRCP